MDNAIRLESMNPKFDAASHNANDFGYGL